MNKTLFSTFKLGNTVLKNRVVMSPMARSRAEENIPNKLMAKYYGQRSAAGLIITEGTSPSPNGLGYTRMPGIFNSKQVEGWKLITKAVHDRGSHIFVQLMHSGRSSSEINLPEGAVTVSPSSKANSGEIFTDKLGMVSHTPPKQMTQEDIMKARREFVQAALYAMQAGFDGVEIHGANGYLIEQFINANVNDRADGYGGSVENRSRFLLEVAKETAEAIGKDKVGVRLSPYNVFGMAEGHDYEGLEDTYAYLAEKLSELGIAYIHVVDHSSMGAPAVTDSVKQKIRDNFKGAYILSGGYSKKRAEADLEAGKGELVAFGRPFIANPDLVERMEMDAPLNEPDTSTFYTPGEKGYTDYPFLKEVIAG
ncbi:alkene reductase [Pontibacter silvestris]|uniref:Alkene reductase n=1 Tax=Pontibacter silvestris TaxID=2305183 RepID=A0ABW4WZY9_9BACT|nr:alkene reductase [Pontibacter silvestris]MCC9138838.1 alkene reductase [Pontibacter silvestris]